MKKSASSSNRKLNFTRLIGLSAIILAAAVFINALPGIRAQAEGNGSFFGLANFFSGQSAATENAAPQTELLSPQATLITPSAEGGFELGADFPSNGWTVVNGTNNRLFVGTTAVPSAGVNSAFSGTTAASWTGENVANVNHFYRDITFPAGEGNIALSFKYKVSVADPTFDFLRVFLVPTSTTPVAGTQLSSGQIGSTYDSATAYATVTIQVPPSAAGTTQRLVFSWRTDAFTPNAAVAVDEISLVTAVQVPVVGTKTIDNTLPTAGNNYASFTAAINDLNSNGTGAGGVTFNVTAGQTFNELTPAIIATGTATTPIVFQKAGAGANPIVQGTNGVGTADAGITISGGDFITFNGIDIVDNAANTTATTRIEYGYLIRNASGTDGAFNNTIQNTNITLNRANTVSVGILQSSDTLGGGVTPTTLGGANSNNRYYNLNIQNAYSGIYLRTLIIGGDTNNEVGTTGGGTTTVGGATAGDIGAGTTATWGIRALGQTNVKIFNAEVRNVSVTSTVAVDGIWLDQTAGVSEAFNNKVHDIRNTSTSATTAMSGIRANHPTAVPGNTNRVYNNFVYNILTGYTGTATATRQVKGIRVQDNGSGAGNTANIDFNSVRLDLGTNLNMSSAAFEIGTTSGPVINVRNNIFSNFTGAQTGVAKHYTWVTTSGTLTGAAGSVSDHNDLYIANTTNGFVGLTNATDRATLSDWQNAVNQDFRSVSVNPQFVSATDLHIAASTALEGNGSYFNGAITWVTQDIDAQPRNANFPDIGADETAFAPVDTLAPDIFFTPVGNTTDTTSRTLTATIVDQSGVPTSGTGLPVLYFRKGTTGAFTAVQGVYAGGSNYTFTINYSAVGGVVAGDTIQYYIVAQDNLGNVGSLPQVGAAGFTANPPAAATPPTTPFSYIIATAFTGAINVGATETITSLTNAGGLFAQLNNGILTGNITVNLTSDLTAEDGTVALNQLAESGAGGYTVTFQASGGARLISGSNTTALITLNGADRVTFSGLAFGPNGITIRNTSTTTGAVVRFINDASNNSIVSCVLEGGNTAAASGVVLFSTGTTTGNDNNAISDSTIRDRTDPTGGVPANLVNSAGTSTAVSNSGNILNNNKLINFTAAGFTSTINADNWTLTNNEISQTAARTTALTGINFNGVGTNTISGNSIHDLRTSFAAGTSISTAGIFLADARNTTVSRNRLYNFPAVAAGTGRIVGIEFGGSSSNPASVNLVNNMISVVTSVATAQSVFGIFDFAFGGNTITANFNSIYIGGTASGAANSWALVRGTLAPTNFTARNNIAFNNRTGGTGSHFAAGDESAGTGTFVSNYNFFAGTGATTPANFFDLGTSGAGTPVPFATWQAGPPTRDANSTASEASTLTVSNFFVDADGGDLHLKLTATQVINAGTPITGITTDFDGQTRDATPDIGADEIVPGTLVLSSATYTVGEGGGTVTITVNRTGGSNGAVSVPYTLTDGATNPATGGANCSTTGVDYVNAGGTVNFADGVTTQTFTVTICQDAVFEGNETFNVNLGTATGGATVGTPATAVVTITDDKTAQAGTFDFGAATYSIGEGGGSLSVPVNRTNGGNVPVTVSYSVGGTATGNTGCSAGADYITPSGTLVFNPGDTVQNITLTICDDASFEGNETIVLTLTGATNGGTIGTTFPTTTVTIIENEIAQPGTVQFSAANYPVGEGGAITITVNRTGGSDGSVSVNYATVTGGTATGGANCMTAGVDYLTTSGTLTFAQGVTSQTFNVTICPDSLDEANETINLQLSNAMGGATIGTQSTATITIADDDATPSLSISDVSLAEGNAGTTAFNFTVTLSAASGQTVTVNYATANDTATAPSDYAAISSTTLTFAPGETTKTVTVNVVGDTLNEPNETFFVNLSGATNATISDSQGLGTITNDDAVPTLSINDVSQNEGNSGTTAFNFTVTLSAASGQTVTVNYATADGTATSVLAAPADFTAIPSTLLTFAPGETTKQVTVLVNGDTVNEANETFFVNLTTPTNATIADAQGQGTIVNDDAAGSISISDVSLNEGNSGTTAFDFTVTLSSVSAQVVSVNYATADSTATQPSDYTEASGTLMFTPGQTTKTVTVLVNGDTQVEPNEEFFVNLFGATNGTIVDNQATGTIVNDDSFTPGTLTINDARVTEGDSGTQNVQFTVTLNNPNPQPASVQYTVGGGTATAGVDYTATPASGTLNFGNLPAKRGSDGVINQTATVTVSIIGDTKIEPNETFFVTLSNPTNATIGDNQGVGIIVDDDRAYTSDFDNDRITDFTVFRPSNGYWYTLQSTNNTVKSTLFGIAEDVPVPGDYDADGIVDIAVFRPSNGVWYILRSSDSGFVGQAWGATGDIPTQGDFDGDGKTDLAVFRPSNGTWYVIQSSTNTSIGVAFGANGDRPVQGDYDGDGKTDYAVFRSGTWFVLRSATNSPLGVQFGAANDKPVVGDFDGDGKTDFTVYRNGTWFVFQSLTNTSRAVAFGDVNDIPTPADYDGDGTSDISVFRPNASAIFYYLRSSDNAFGAFQWGQTGDRPIPAHYQSQP